MMIENKTAYEVATEIIFVKLKEVFYSDRQGTCDFCKEFHCPFDRVVFNIPQKEKALQKSNL